MDTSNSLINVCVSVLRSSPHPEDHQLAEDFKGVLETLMMKVKPILRYLCTGSQIFNESEIRCTQVCRLPGDFYEHFLYVAEGGTFFRVRSDTSKSHPELYHHPKGIDAWELMPFVDLLENLRTMISRAEQKRVDHLRSISERREILDRVRQTIETSM